MIVVLASGGVDSACALKEFSSRDEVKIALFVNYGQKGAEHERAAAKWQAERWAYTFEECDIHDVYKAHSESVLVKEEGVTDEVSNRNALLVHLAAARYPGSEIVLSIHKSTIHDLPDCTYEWALNLNKSLYNAVLCVPFLLLFKSALLKRLTDEEIQHTYTCYLGKPKGTPCECTACVTMKKFGY